MGVFWVKKGVYFYVANALALRSHKVRKSAKKVRKKLSQIVRKSFARLSHFK